MYESPINVIYGQMQTQMEGDIFRAVQSYAVDVDKEELLRVLRYDRDQYTKGYADGKRDAMDELVRCRDCKNACDEGLDTYTCRAFPYKGIGGLIPGDGFCHYGERREGE